MCKAGATGFVHVHPDIKPDCPLDIGERWGINFHTTTRWRYYGDTGGTTRPEISLVCYCPLLLLP